MVARLTLRASAASPTVKNLGRPLGWLPTGRSNGVANGLRNAVKGCDCWDRRSLELRTVTTVCDALAPADLPVFRTTNPKARGSNPLGRASTGAGISWEFFWGPGPFFLPFPATCSKRCGKLGWRARPRLPWRCGCGRGRRERLKDCRRQAGPHVPQVLYVRDCVGG